MASLRGIIGNVALVACLVPVVLFFEHGHVPLPRLSAIYHFIFWILPLRFYSIIRWTFLELFYLIWYFPSNVKKIVMACRFGSCGWRMYLTYWFFEIKLFTRTYVDLIFGALTLVFYIAVGLALWSWWTDEGSFYGVSSIAGSLCVRVLRYIPERIGIISPKDPVEEKFDVNDSYGDAKVLTTGLIADLKHAGIKASRRNIFALLKVAMEKGKPVDDKLMTMEKMIAVTASLKPSSKSRKRLTNTIIRTLWDSLEHPPRSYLGDKFQYRTPDGSYNNILIPHLGQAGTPYARAARQTKRLHGVRPDPGLLFDLLMSRDDKSFRENPAGISSVLFYHATIIVHDIFRTNRKDANISDTSSYLDLAPLYGSSLEDQLKIRTMSKGLLKPDTFHEKRLLAQPPGVNVILIMYSRFHNYVADVLLKINENDRFTLQSCRTDEEKKKALAKQDNDLFQTARLIVGGLYVNISLHDYLRGLTNTHHSNSTWTLDPRVEINKQRDGSDVERGGGNQVSAEFNLLYRFHGIISQRDEKWLVDFLGSIFPGKVLSELPPAEFFQGFLRYEAAIDPDPSKRTFDGLKRGPDGRFNDEELVSIITSSMEDPAGLFGSRMVPKALRMVEILGIIQSRKWGMASLNEFRHFFGLKKHESMEDINPDPEISSLLRSLYDHPDMVELYPGLFIEDAKPRLDPGCGGCPPYTVGRAVFSDAVTLVRSDRFYTIDYTAATLTNWGLQEVQQDYKVLGGSMFYKLFQRAFPGWYPYNSLHIMQPMFTWKMNKQIAEEIKTIDQFSLKGPKKPAAPVIVTKHSTVMQVLKDQTAFRVPWLPSLDDLFPGKTTYSSFMLSGDASSNAKQRKLVESILCGPDQFGQLVMEFVTATAKNCLETESFQLNVDNLCQVDIIRDIAIPVNARLLGDLFYLDLKGTQHPRGTLTTKELYTHLLNVRTWGFNNNDTGLAFLRRIWAQEGATVLTKTTKSNVRDVVGSGLCLRAKRIYERYKNHIKPGSLRWYGQHVVRQLHESGLSTKEVAEIMWLTAVAGVGVPVGLFAEILQFFLQPANVSLWEQIQDLVASSGPTTDSLLKQYVQEAQRLVSTQRDLRTCETSVTIDDQKFTKGDTVICLFGPACQDPVAIPDPKTFKLGRPSNAYLHFGFGVHECLGREIALTYCVGLLKVVASLKHLRPAPGSMGVLKSITVGTERSYLDDTWTFLTFDPTTWKLHYEGFGKGAWKPKTPEPKKADPPKEKPKQIIVDPEGDGQWHWVPSKSNSDSGSPKGKPPPPPIAQSKKPSDQANGINPDISPVPIDLGPLHDVFQCAVDWFYVAASHRDPTACMPDEIKPPPPPPVSSPPTSSPPASSPPSSSSQTSLSQSWQSVENTLPSDLRIKDPFQNDCAWFWSPESSRDVKITMPDSIKPPPIPNPATPARSPESPRTVRSLSRSSGEKWQDTQAIGVKRKDMR